MIEQIRFISTLFLCSEFTLRIFTLEYIFAGKKVTVIFICGNLLLRIAGKIAKIITRKNFVPHGR